MHSGPLLGPVASLPSSSTDPLGPNSLLQTPQPKEELKTQFITREGTYRVMTLAEYSRPNRVPLNQVTGSTVGGVGAVAALGAGAPVRVSFLSIDNPLSSNGHDTSSPSKTDNLENEHDEPDPLLYADRICFNVGRELYVYLYRGTECAADLSKPIDKRVYKGTYPTCHTFNKETATATSCSLIIGFSAGQIQMIDPFQKEYTVSRLFNEERLIDKSAVTCLAWVPGQPTQFLVSHSSGNLYLYDEQLQCPQTPPQYQVFKQGERYSVWSSKAKNSKNPIFKWSIGSGPITNFTFSPDNTQLAITSHDGYLRIFDYATMDMLSYFKSYFGGLLCVNWSPDGKLIATGGEDDLLTIYSVIDKRVVCRGQGHRSWISQVSFDPFCCNLENDDCLATQTSLIDLGSGDEAGTSAQSTVVHRRPPVNQNSLSRLSFASFGTSTQMVTSHGLGISYRLGSVGHDTQLCLWDITEDMLKNSTSSQRHRNSTIIAPVLGIDVQTTSRLDPVSEQSTALVPLKEKKKARLHKRGLTLAAKLTGSGGDRHRDAGATAARNQALEEARLLGTKICPRIDEVPMIEPLICKKIAHERLTVLEFRKDCLVTACQEGFICTWARPGKGSMSLVKREMNSPSGLVGASPNENLHNGYLPGSTISASTLGTTSLHNAGYWNN